MQNDCSGPLVAHDALALGSGESFNQTSITATSLVSETAIQSEIPSESVALAVWHLHAWHLNTTQNLLYRSLGKG